jgi:C-terminal processing protease CtpA/Prc
MAQVRHVADDGACSGQLLLGDVITEVNSASVVGKEPQEAKAVFEASCKSLGKVLLQIVRPTIGMQLN